jgi:hypothetical protein
LPGTGTMRVTIENPEGLSTGALQLEVDGAPWTGGPIPFPPAGSARVVRARICGRTSRKAPIDDARFRTVLLEFRWTDGAGHSR